VERLSVEDLLLIAEAVLGVPAERLARELRLATAARALAAPFATESGRERHPSLAGKAAVQCVRLVRDPLFPRGNVAIALLAAIELVERNHGIWIPPSGGQHELVVTLERLAAGELPEPAFAAWMRARVRSGPCSR